MVGMCAICTMDLSRGVLFRMGMLVFQMGAMRRKVRGNKRVWPDNWRNADTAW